MDEFGLARRAAAGDLHAFTMLVRLHEGTVRRFLARLSGQDADDLAQEVFLRAWRDAARFRGEGSYRGWLLRIGWTSYLDVRRATGRREAREAAFDHPAPTGADIPLQIDLDRALARLGERERAAALLCFAEGCSHGEAAAILQVPLGTLKSILARARTTLVAQLETADG